MAMTRIISCLDVLDNLVVKGTSFCSLRRIGAPADLAAFYSREGADELVLLDIGAGPARRPHAVDTLRAVRRAANIPLTVGGGIKSVDDAVRLFESGADKVVVNSAAVNRPELITELVEKFGSQAVVASVDAYRTESSAYLIRTRGGRTTHDIEAVHWIKRCVDLGAGEVLVTSWDADGRRGGYDLCLIAEVAKSISAPVIASGGAASAADFVIAARAGARGLLAAGIFHDRSLRIADLKRSLAQAGIAVRPPEFRVEDMEDN